MSVQGYWADLRAPAFRNLPDNTVAVLPIGAIEQHGPHLPVSVDRDLVNAVIERTLPRLKADQNVLFLPNLAVTKSGEHDRHPGTLSLSAETLMAVLRETGKCVATAGLSRLVLFNGHGGNTAVLEIVARDLRISQNMIVATCSWFGFADYNGLFEGQDLAHDIHAGDIETSAMLAAHPGLVDMECAQDFKPATLDWQSSFQHIGLTEQAARPGWIIEDLNSQGACGNAAAANRDKGEQLLQTAAASFASFLAEFSRFDLRQSS